MLKRLLFILFFALSFHAAVVYANAPEESSGANDKAMIVKVVPVEIESSVEAGQFGQGLAGGNTATEPATKKRFVERWLHLLGTGPAENPNSKNILSYAGKVPADVVNSFRSIGDNTYAGFFGVLVRSIAAIGLGFLILFGLDKGFGSRLDPLKNFSPPENESANVWSLSLIRNSSALVGIFILAVASIIVFLVLAGNVGPKGRMVFQAILGTIIIYKFSALLAKILLSPDDSSCRPLGLAEPLVGRVYTASYLSVFVLFCAILWIWLMIGIDMHEQTLAWLVLLAGISIITIYCFLILYLKQPVAEALQEDAGQRQAGWVKRQLATYWHIPALSYLILVLLIWIGQYLDGPSKQGGEFIFSMLIVPIYFALKQMGRHVIVAVVDSLGLGKIDEEDKEKDQETLEREAAENRQKIVSKSESIFNLIVFGTLIVWLLSLWGYEIPFAANAVSALFQSLVVLALALVCWKSASSYIERKLEEAAPERDEKQEDEDDEFGGAVQAGRLHTLLPMLRKVIGSVLVVMVVLITISSLGVNIGPLLAGAGVIGLAVGFGAQKLVSDILSGFFYLLDDAFRVGEYIEAGSNRGSVEAITLRNIMLRHSQGMLQIVPHSELGAITNYMRGGIVVKFPLEFPYDTNIDQVRKVIKKVGIAMLDDPELGEDFIRPVKSQGVNEITNSVMVIRVKFTAKPGKQFVIKREAFRRITEALNAKGIYYAHRKVIVDFPNGQAPENLDEASRQKMAEAAAAASVAAENDKGGQPA